MPAVDIVRRFRRLRAVVIGDAMLDSYLEGDASRLCTEGPVPVVRQTVEERVPGGAANCAANAASLGAAVSFIGLVGDDVEGALLRRTLRSSGIEDRWLVTDPAARTLHKLRILANDQYVVRYDSGETRNASPGARAQLLRHLEETLLACDVVIVSDYGYGVVGDDLLARLRALRRNHPCPLVVDSKDVRRFAGAGATVVTPNHLEARIAVEGHAPYPEPGYPGSLPASGYPEAGEGAVEQVVVTATALLKLVDAEYAAVTMAQRGVVLAARGGGWTHLPTHPVPHPGEVGAGDSFTAAVGLALAAGADVTEAARIGIEAASLAVAQPRTIAVRHGELLQRVSLNAGAPPPTLLELCRQLDGPRRDGKTIVFTNGIFDILHAGHVHFLREAKRLGDILVVGVNSDRSVRRMKGPGRPINREHDRLALVGELDPVDHVVLFDEDDPSSLIRTLRPHVHVKGGDYQDTVLPEEPAVREGGGRVVILPLVGSISTTTVIERIVAMALEGVS